ncbi:putative protein with domain of unknown function (DUF427) [Lyophyllum shimeji]|uniref:DUF427 domain-containing protein n=1 Tax=Lyophyllum shimeji TaxID=47721 RepID=A0A9P3PQR5_LYOSH|nr:putative protein with domain of unknown function (DUF427) [Lyophyllum shimeji]
MLPRLRRPVDPKYEDGSLMLHSKTSQSHLREVNKLQPPLCQPTFAKMSFTLPLIEDSPKRVRAFFSAKYIVDSTQAKLVWEKPYHPAYFFLEEEMPKEYLELQESDSYKEVYDVVVGHRRAPAAVTCYLSKSKNLAGLFTIKFGAMDAWFEEEDQIYVHVRDPYKRVDIRQSSRHVRVEIQGVEVANTHMPRFLYETGLRVRTYIPKPHCRLEYFEPSKLVTECAYKGEAKFYHVQIPSHREDDIAWWYRNPTPGCGEIRGFVAFADERVDMWVDGEKQEH